MPDLKEDGVPQLTLKGAVATLTLCRPSQHNRIAPQDCDVISHHLRQLEKTPELRLLIITGSASKTFSSGYTLGAIKDQLDSRFENMLDHLERFPLPTLCVLNGSVYGGATDLALCCDLRIGLRGTRMFMPAARIGLHYYPGGIRRYVTLLGLAAAKKLFLTGLSIDDDEMLRIGFLHERVAADELEATVRRYIDGILEGETNVLITMKADLMAQAANTADEAVMRSHYDQSLKSASLAARLQALEKL
ncbi:hypothetical protein AWM79_23885 [Pseudomonas agarici]|uniref:3-hydroxybutyryl-CoA dehydratase n=1 Tax=Pseudomonas agarici TaxID=46677 RepID=A0A0X1T7N9_PSEAA|nr:enoyl-CoA hydratase/isomerase family protein [Pseudomonas agarici]AMB88150.1 hypothetical protein AWM79_23885 [Pseudomonas agarici]NWB93585.1 enoyl-CoA hydratase/isomerase family protein [Pseudomonas agarici]